MKGRAWSAAISRASLLLVLGTVLLAYLPILGNEFVNWEDDVFLIQNNSFKQLGLPNILWMFTSHLVGTYQPLCWLLWAVVFRVWGLSPGAFHAVSLTMHLAMTAGVFLLAIKLLEILRPGAGGDGPARVGACSLAAILFALHPLQVEAVALAGVQGDILASVFFVFSILAYLEGAARTRSSPGWRRLSWLLALGAGLSRWHVAALPVVLIVLDFYPLGRLGPSRSASGEVWFEKLPFFLLAALFVLINALAKGRMGIYEGEYGTVFDSISAVMFYPWKLAAIGSQLPVYLLSAPGNQALWSPLPGVILFAGTTALLIKARIRRPAGLAAWVCYLAAIAPSLSVFLSGRPLFGHDRYAYLACVPFFLLAAGLFESCLIDPGASRFTVKHAVIFAAVLLIFFFGFKTARQIRVWRGPIPLWTHALAADPVSRIAIFRMGDAFVLEGRFDEAIRLFQDQMKHDPGVASLNLASAYIAKGIHRLNEGRFGEARILVREAMRHNPAIPEDILFEIEAAADGAVEKGSSYRLSP